MEAEVWILLGVVVVGAMIGVGLWRWRVAQATARRSADPRRREREALRGRLRALRAALPARTPLVASELPGHPVAATIEAHLLAGDLRAALGAAEHAVAEAPKDAAAQVLLARALLAADALLPASAAIVRARELGARVALLDHVEGRVEQLLWLRRMNPGHPPVQTQITPPLVTPFDRFVLRLQSRQPGQTGAVWLTGSDGGGTTTLDPDEVVSLIERHHEVGLRSLELLLGAAERAPGATELTYHAARRALQTGFAAEGRALFDALAPLMEGHPEHTTYERDRAELEGRPDLPAEPPMSTPPGARRSPRLTIVK